MFRQGSSACGFQTAGLPEGPGIKPLSTTQWSASLHSIDDHFAGLEPAPIVRHTIALPAELKMRIPTPTCALRSLRNLLGRGIQHAACRSPTGYLTECKDSGFAPDPLHSAQRHLLVRLVLHCATRCPSRLTMSVSRVAAPPGLSRARIPETAEAGSVHKPGTSAHRLTAIPAG